MKAQFIYEEGIYSKLEGPFA